MIKQRVWNKKGIRAFPLRLTELFFTYRMNGLERLALILSYAAEKSPVFACHIAKLKANGQPSALVRLCGKEGSGRRFFLRHLVSERGCAILSLPLSELCEMQETYRREVLNGLSMITRLSGLVLAFEGAVPKGKERIAAYIVERLLSVSKVLFWVCESEEKLEVPETAEALSLNFALPTPPERLLLWEKFSCDCKLSPEVQLSFFANTYKLSPEEIGSVLKQAKAETDFESLSPPFGKKPKRIEKSRLVAISSGRGTEKLSGLADRISPAFGWEDLILDEEQKDILRLACSRLNFAHKVGCDWGFDKTVVYGRGVSVLLYGPSGTGKTMSAQIMAAETGMELYRVDLSRLSSKYVGETEKNVSKLFEEAKNLNIILFFDEADSLFSKRTDITDSNDKFANAETAFILQQVEQYEGMCILATNLYKNFDSAFIRRISCVVKFSLPDEERRYLLWKSIIPEKAPVSPDLDLRFLAESFDMSGSEIKSVIYTAAFIAAEKDQPISMNHIIKALRIDFAKAGKLLSESLLGPYGR